MPPSFGWPVRGCRMAVGGDVGGWPVAGCIDGRGLMGGSPVKMSDRARNEQPGRRAHMGMYTHTGTHTRLTSAYARGHTLDTHTLDVGICDIRARQT